MSRNGLSSPGMTPRYGNGEISNSTISGPISAASGLAAAARALQLAPILGTSSVAVAAGTEICSAAKAEKTKEHNRVNPTTGATGRAEILARLRDLMLRRLGRAAGCRLQAQRRPPGWRADRRNRQWPNSHSIRRTWR